MASFRRLIRNHAKLLGIGLFILTFIANSIFDIPDLWGQVPLGWVVTAFLLVVLNLHIFPQYWTKIWTKIKYGRLEDYTCKGNYKLPFAETWCVFAGGTTQNLSADWNELIMRYSYFFAMVDNHGNACTPHDRESELENHYSYGKNVLATADGVVVKVCNKHMDSLNEKSAEMVAYVGTADLMGNHIIMRHHKNEYSCVGNLMYNSATVKVGDTVKQGDVIAQCGNSGYLADTPSLQFQLQSSKSFNLSTSLPIAFSHIKAADSTAYDLACKVEGIRRPSTKGNLRVVGGKTFIGRGLDVKNEAV